MSTHIPHPTRRHPSLRILGQFVLAIDLGFLALTFGIVVLAGFGVLADPVALGIVLAGLVVWGVHAIRIRRNMADEHAAITHARERRGF